jgi:Xaa-Pro dipeptidase
VEFPNLGPDSDFELRPNMTLGLKLDLHGLPFGGVRFEITVRITPTGCQPLNQILSDDQLITALRNGVA